MSSTLVRHVALVSETQSISPSELTRVAAALQKQVVRDFAPIWEVSATVNAFVKLEDVPLGYWPIVVKDNIDEPGALGVHLDKNGQPYALVTYDRDWSLTSSHECLEMLADPFGSRVIAGQSPKRGQGRVEFLVEVCDPSEEGQFAYRANGIWVSDFYTPHYFDPVKSTAVRYSFTGAITQPRQVLKGGYLTWHNPIDDHWYQETFFSGARPRYRDLGVLSGRMTGSIRETVDRLTPTKPRIPGDGARARSSSRAALFAAGGAGGPLVGDEFCEESEAKATSLREQIATLPGAGGTVIVEATGGGRRRRGGRGGRARK